MMGFFTSPRIGFGPGAIEQLAGLEPHRVLLLVAPSVSGLDGVRRIEEFVRHLEIEISTRVVGRGPTTIEQAEQLAAQANSADPAYNPLMTTLQEIGRTSEANLIPALKAQCDAANNPTAQGPVTSGPAPVTAPGRASTGA